MLANSFKLSGPSKRSASATVFIIFTLVLCGCSLHRPSLAPLPSKGATTGPKITDKYDYDQDPWWGELRSVDLDLYIRRALAENYDVDAARERLAQAVALRHRSDSDLWPEVEVQAGIDKEIYAKGRARRHGFRKQAAFALDWRPDLFGRQSSAVVSASATAQARLFEAEAFRLDLSANVADTYYGIVEQRRLLSLYENQIATAKELLGIIRERYNEGLISMLDVLQQESQLAELESQIPAAQSTLDTLSGRFSALLAAHPDDRSAMAAGSFEEFPDIEPIAPLDNVEVLLSSRPDLRASQAILVASDAETGRALAERLPNLTLSSDALRVKTGSAPSISTLDIGVELVQPLLDWGSRRQEWLRSRSRQREFLANYSQEFLEAVWEVDGLLRSENRQRQLLESLLRRQEILEALMKQARNRYHSGLTDYLPVLTATQQLYSVEQRLIRERRRLISFRIDLRRSLGGPIPDYLPKS